MKLLSPEAYAKSIVASVQEYSLLCGRTIACLFSKPRYIADTYTQMDSIGVGSLPIVVLTGFFTGCVLALQAAVSLKEFGAVNMTGRLVSLSMIKELGPVLTGLMVSGRNASGMASELGSMKVTEQIDAIEASAVDPHKLLAATRIAACFAVLPLLTLAASFSGVFMGWLTDTLIEPISLTHFINAGFRGASFRDFLPPTFKTCAFGLIIGTVSSFVGMTAKGGAEGVGNAATRSVVLSSLFVILADVILVKLILLIFP